MNILKSFGAMITIFILRNLLKLHGRKIIPIKWDDQPEIEIPFEDETYFNHLIKWR